MPLLAGVDGCPQGWIRVTQNTETGAIASHVYPTAQTLLAQLPQPAVLAIDIPLGLSDEPRICDVTARGMLGKSRGSSVFRPPIRAALQAGDREEAQRITENAIRLRVPAQAWGIYQKVAQLDALFREDPNLQHWVKEVHPEVCFWAWNDSQAMRHAKKTREGKRDRQLLIAGFFGAQSYQHVRRAHAIGDVGHDDIADAFAALWTARRIHQGTAVVIPNPPHVDDFGLPMTI